MFQLTGRIIEERRLCLLSETVEMLACIKDWELGERRLQHAVDNKELEDSFKNLYLDEEIKNASGLLRSVHLWLLLLLVLSVLRLES
jgi:hypothetical protein